MEHDVTAYKPGIDRDVREFSREECLAALTFWLKRYVISVSDACPELDEREVKGVVEHCVLETLSLLWFRTGTWEYVER